MLKKINYLLLILILSGCNIFQPRKAEEPRPPAQWHPFTVTALMCLENLVFSYNYKQNMFNFERILSNDFVFYFDRNDVTDFSLPISWEKDAEKEMLINAHQRVEGDRAMDLILTSIVNQPDDIGLNIAWIYRNYELFVYHDDQNISNTFAGQFQLLLERENDGLWRIMEWHDFRKDSLWTWGRMKNEFRT